MAAVIDAHRYVKFVFVVWVTHLLARTLCLVTVGLFSWSADVGGRLAPPNEDAFAQDSMKRSGGTKAAASSEQYLSGPIEMQVDGTRRWQRRGSHAAPATGDVDLRAVAHQSNKSGETIDRIIAAIRGTTILFTDMDRDQLEQVAHAMEEVETEAGQVIIRQGDHGDYFYVIESGEYVAEKDGEPVCTYSGTGSFGELALMYGAPRAASVRVLTSGLLWRLDRTTFRMIVVISNAIR